MNIPNFLILLVICAVLLFITVTLSLAYTIYKIDKNRINAKKYFKQNDIKYILIYNDINFKSEKFKQLNIPNNVIKVDWENIENQKSNKDLFYNIQQYNNFNISNIKKWKKLPILFDIENDSSLNLYKDIFNLEIYQIQMKIYKFIKINKI